MAFCCSRSAILRSRGSGLGGMGLAAAFISFSARLAESLGAGVDVQAASITALSSAGTTQRYFMQSSLQHSQTCRTCPSSTGERPMVSDADS
ncbi:MAG: hypothetical protein LZF60_140129 [Nitrospira sp.]|nr:MAG: hypothetical protein LZF60_140129 [Nitrospira sp.]